MVIYEHANYWDQIIRKDILSQHLKKINVKEHSLALEVVYHFFTNNELSKSAISYARSRTIKIRYAREIAACLSKKYSAQEVVEWVANAISSEKFKTGTNLK